MTFFKFFSKIRIQLAHFQQKIPKKQFTFLLSISVGLVSGLAAVLLKKSVHFIFKIATENKFSDNYYISLGLPMLGIALTYWVIQHILGGKLVKGLAPLHFNIAQKNSLLPPEQTYAQLLTSAVTVGLGGSSGLEAPIVITGAALGSNFAKYFRLNYADRTLLLACGVAAGIGSAFNAPIAGVLFTIEVLLLDISTAGFIPLLIAAASGALMSKIILNEETVLRFESLQPFNFHNTPFYIILGILAGVVSIYHAKMFVRIEKHFSRLSHQPYRRIIYAGTVLALLIFVFPSLFGEGYSSIKTLVSQQPAAIFKNSFLSDFVQNEWLLLLAIGGVMLCKAVATAVTLGGGGNGGNFAPSLFVGSYLGFLYAKFLNMAHIATVPEGNFTIVGMAGVLSGLYHAPLTAIFLIGELTGGYTLMIPLMLVSSISYLVAKTIEPHTMDTKQLAENRQILSANKDTNILITMKINALIETNFVVLKQTDNIKALVTAIISSERNIFPVVDEMNKFCGIILLNDVKNIVFNETINENLQLKDIMKPAPDLIDITDDIPTIVEKFEETQAWNLPVVEHQIYKGFVSKSKLFSSYRDELINRTIG